MRPKLRSTIVLLCLSLLAACSSRSPTGPSTTNAIRVRDNQYTPASTTVALGTTVTWTWEGSNPHTVTFSGGPASAQQTSGTFQRTFNAAGTFDYQCAVHGASMSGSVTVSP